MSAWQLDAEAFADHHLEESMAQIQRGEGITGERAREILAERRAARKA